MYALSHHVMNINKKVFLSLSLVRNCNLGVYRNQKNQDVNNKEKNKHQILLFLKTFLSHRDQKSTSANDTKYIF